MIARWLARVWHWFTDRHHSTPPFDRGGMDWPDD